MSKQKNDTAKRRTAASIKGNDVKALIDALRGTYVYQHMCDDDHEEVGFNGYDGCPVCQMRDGSKGYR